MNLAGNNTLKACTLKNDFGVDVKTEIYEKQLYCFPGTPEKGFFINSVDTFLIKFLRKPIALLSRRYSPDVVFTNAIRIRHRFTLAIQQRDFRKFIAKTDTIGFRVFPSVYREISFFRF